MIEQEITYCDNYENNSWFGLYEADATYIVYRSKISSYTSEKYPNLKTTVDVVFIGTMYFEFMPDFHGIKISKPKTKKSFELARKFDKGFDFLESNERVYKIRHGKEDYFPEIKTSYLVAAGIWIYEHNCQNKKSFIEAKTKDYFDKVEKTLKLN